MRKRVENMKDAMWKKNKSFCLEPEVQDSEFPATISI